jgi:hypothetical protein
MVDAGIEPQDDIGLGAREHSRTVVRLVALTRIDA